MIVKLYTSRVLLNVLGIDDYGVYNAVAAFVISFSFISSPLVTATQRFLNYDMGKGGQQLNKLFVTNFLMFLIVSVIIIAALETVGTWFLNSKMNFSGESMPAINALYQLTIFSLIINFLRMPYESVFIAEEKMSFYAIVCMLEAILSLATAFALLAAPDMDKLILYGLLNVICAVILALIYKIYCNRKFQYTKIKKLQFDRQIFKEVCTFSGWNFFGSCASMTATQGITTLINIFFGVVYNAAYGIAIQIQSAVAYVVQNFQKAANPQIVKSYSEGSLEHTRFLVINVSKFSFILTLLFVVPLMCNIDFVLKLWLGKTIPHMANLFSFLMLCLVSLVSFAGPMETGIMASGNIKSFQITFSIIIFFNILATYLFFSNGASAYWAIIIKCGVEIIVICSRIFFLRKRISLGFRQSLIHIFLPCGFITALSAVFVLAIIHLFPYGGWLRMSVSSVTYVIVLASSTYFVLLSRSQRNKLTHLKFKNLLP